MIRRRLQQLRDNAERLCLTAVKAGDTDSADAWEQIAGALDRCQLDCTRPETILNERRGLMQPEPSIDDHEQVRKCLTQLVDEYEQGLTHPNARNHEHTQYISADTIDMAVNILKQNEPKQPEIDPDADAWLWLVVAGEEYIPHAFATEQEAIDFWNRNDDAVSGPWKVPVAIDD